MPALPVTILTGFLGGGKTTLLRRLLGTPTGQRVGILLNERGVAGIDDLGPRDAAGFIELADGCVCCVDQGDLVAALGALAGRGDLDRVIVETTGLADPLPIAWTIGRPDLEELVTLDAVVAVVDAANHATTHVEEWEAQVRSADLVVLTKLDLVPAEDAERARAAVQAINARARILDGEDGLLALVPPESFEFLRGRPASDTRPKARHGSFETAVFAGTERYDAARLEDLVEDLPAAVFRAKGIARTEDGWASFNAVGGRMSFEPSAAAPAHGESRLVFFGRGLDRAALAAALAECLQRRAS
mgnify:CR=1 FL=1